MRKLRDGEKGFNHKDLVLNKFREECHHQNRKNNKFRKIWKEKKIMKEIVMIFLTKIMNLSKK